jgi:hypothetical protein
MHQPFRLIPTGSASFLTDLRRPIRHSSSIAAAATASAFLLVSLSKMPRGSGEVSTVWLCELAPKHFRSRLTTFRPSGLQIFAVTVSPKPVTYRNAGQWMAPLEAKRHIWEPLLLPYRAIVFGLIFLLKNA